MMQVWLARTLPQIGIALAAVAVFWWIDHRYCGHAMADRDARNEKILAQVGTQLRESEAHLTDAIKGIDDRYQTQRESLAHTGATLQPIIVREAARDPRLSDPALGLTPGLLDAINPARTAGSCTAAAAERIACTLPATPARDGSGDR